MSQPAAPTALACRLCGGGSGRPHRPCRQKGPQGAPGECPASLIQGDPVSPLAAAAAAVWDRRGAAQGLPSESGAKKPELLGKPPPGPPALPAPGLGQRVFSRGGSAAPGVPGKPGGEQPFAGQVAELLVCACVCVLTPCECLDKSLQSSRPGFSKVVGRLPPAQGRERVPSWLNT